MTYLRFHLIFNFPLVVLLFLLSLTTSWSSNEIEALLWVLVAVFIFTVPWDNLAAKWGIWGFARESYLLRIGYLPIEEYAFFLLQALCVMLTIRVLFSTHPDWLTNQDILLTPWTYLCLGASLLIWLGLGFQALWVRRWLGARANYALHLAWFLPVIYFQWIIAFPLFYAHLSLLLAVTFAYGLYYTLADLVAVRAGTWFFDEKQTTGWNFLKILPWEEIAFFFLTSLLVAQSYLLLLPSEAR